MTPPNQPNTEAMTGEERIVLDTILSDEERAEWRSRLNDPESWVRMQAWAESELARIEVEGDSRSAGAIMQDEVDSIDAAEEAAEARVRELEGALREGITTLERVQNGDLYPGRNLMAVYAQLSAALSSPTPTEGEWSMGQMRDAICPTENGDE